MKARLGGMIKPTVREALWYAYHALNDCVNGEFCDDDVPGILAAVRDELRLCLEQVDDPDVPVVRDDG